MPDKYFCAHCDEEFVVESPQGKPRCPTCMRRGGVDPVKPTVEERTGARKGVVVAAIALLIGAIGYGVYRANTVTLEETPPLRPLETRELAAYLERDQIEVGRLDALFAIPSGRDWPPDETELATAIEAKAAAWALDHPLPREVYTADQTLAALDASEDKPRLYPIEAALAMAAVLRERGVRAMVAEAWDFGEREPPDPTGLFGYFVVAVYEDGADGPTAFFDPWGGRQAPSPRAFRVLRDTEVIAAALGIDAARIFVKSGDGVAALPLVETALSLDPSSPTLRGVYGTVLLETGGAGAGIDELEAARELRPDAPRELNLVQISLAKAAMMQMAGEAAAADAELTAASQTIDRIIDRWPGYARAHLVLAMLHFGIDEPERARAELEVARKLEPTTASLAAAWAQYYLSQGDDAAAIVQAKKAVKLNPEDWQLRLQIARVLMEAGDDQAAQEQVQAALALVPSRKRNELEQYLARALGRKPFGDQRSPTTSAPGDLVLPKPSIGDAPSAPVPAPGDPSLMLGDPSDLRLRDPGQRLRLDLDD